MKILEKVRYYSFWFLDFLKGGKIKGHFTDIKYILENFDTDESIKRRNDYLENILNHAVNTVPFYSKTKGFNSITEFPIVNKLILREQFDNFLSKKHNHKKSFEVSTSGSTGTPFLVRQDIIKKQRNRADTIYFSRKAGYNIGHKLFYMRAWGNLIKKKKNHLFFTKCKDSKC